MRIDFNKLSDIQKDNLNNAIDSYKRRDLIVKASPPVLYIELTRNCPARCIFCSRPKDNRYDPSKNMPDEIFDILEKEYLPYAVFVDLRCQGESLSHPNFPRYVKAVAKHSPRMQLVTTLGCGRKEALQSLVDHDVFISVSFDAADKRLYEKIRRGLKYDTVIQNLEFVIKGMKEKYGTIEDKIRFSVCPFQKKNLNAVEGIFELANNYGISEIRFGPLSTSSYDANNLENNKYGTYRAFKKMKRLAEKNKINLQLSISPFEEVTDQEIAFDMCCHPWMYFQIMYDGDAIFCDHLIGDFHKQRIVGNIRDSKESVWNGSKAQTFRECHLTRPDNQLMLHCNTCYKKGRYADHEHEFCDNFSRWLFDEKMFDKTIKILSRKKLQLVFSDAKYYLRHILLVIKHAIKNLLRKILNV